MNAAQRRRYAWVLPVTAVALAAGILLGRAGSGMLPGWLALAMGLGATALLRDRARLAGWAAAVCALGFLLGWTGYHPVLPAEGDSLVTGVVCDEITLEDTGRLKTRLCSVTLNGSPAGDAYWSCYPEEVPEGLIPGARVTFTGRVYAPGGAENPGGFDFREYLLGQGITYGLYGCTELAAERAPFTLQGEAAALRHRLTERLMAVMGREAGAYAAAMLLGTKAYLPEEDRAAFSRVGVAHLLTVSGFHVGILAWLLAWLLCWCAPRVRLAATAAVLAGYCLLAGGSAPVVRAAMLVLLGQWGRVHHRPVQGLWLWCACFCASLAVRPAQLTSASFQLTYGAVLGLAVVSPGLRRLWRPKGKALQRIWQSLCASFGAQVGVALPLAWWFQELPLLGLVINLAAIPVASALIVLYWATLALLGVPGLGAALGAASGWLTGAMTAAVGWLNQWPVISLWCCRANLVTAVAWAGLLAGCCLLVRLRGRWRAALLACCTLALGLSLTPWPHRGTEYVQLSVGNADAAVLWDGDDVTVIDTGEDGRALSAFLRQRRLTVDRLILTHLHADHAGGVAGLLAEGIPVREVLLPWGAAEAAVDPQMAALVDALAAEGASIRRTGRGDTIVLPSGGMTVLWPEAGRVRPGQDANESSLVLLAEIRGTAMLLTGDLDGRYEQYAATQADILKVAHHGSASASGEAFLAAVAPRAAILSGGDAQRHAATAARMPAVPLYATESRGAVTVRLADGGYEISGFLADE